MGKTLPDTGTPWPDLEAEMKSMAGTDVDWRNGRAAVYIFHSGDDVMTIAHEAYGLFIAENGLGPAAFPSLRRMEREVVDMALDLQGAPEGARGSMTSGGSESILLAIKACRDYVLAGRDLSGTPEILAPYSAHPAFDKGAHMMGLKVRRVPCDDFLADPQALAAAVNDNTIMLVGSAPCFPYGLIDPITDLGQLALERDLWLHVDACVGGYLNPFMAEANGRAVEPYNFSVPGVSSMSLDLHKYGYAAKGASTVLYADEERYQAQVFHFSDWPCGHMYTPTFAGTRPGGAIAAAWAVLHYLGRDGYVDRARNIKSARETLVSGCQELGLEVMGNPELSIVAYGWQEGDVLALGESLYERGWFSSRVQNPDGIQYMISPEHQKTMPDYLAAVAAARDEVRNGRTRRSEVKYS